jgi:hypothetical protein
MVAEVEELGLDFKKDDALDLAKYVAAALQRHRDGGGDIKTPSERRPVIEEALASFKAGVPLPFSSLTFPEDDDKVH